MESLYYQKFSELNFADPFFDSLKSDYSEFSLWLNKKASAGESAYVLYDSFSMIEGFLYLKIEDGIVDDVEPNLRHGRHLKIGTFKFNSTGTRRGERFTKKIFDHAIKESVDDIYVTVFDEHDYLMRLFCKYGFEIYGRKSTVNGVENVLVRDLLFNKNDILNNYPKININNVKKYILSIFPLYHSRMLPDSILNNESHDIIQDISHANSIHKIYLCNMKGVTYFKPGDVLVTYRTTDRPGHARHRSVVTSLCVVEEYKHIYEFPTLESFLIYASSYSIFTEQELISFYNSKKYPYIIRFTYNTAMQKRVTRGELIDDVGIPSTVYWGVNEISDAQFSHILSLGEVDESFIIN